MTRLALRVDGRVVENEEEMQAVLAALAAVLKAEGVGNGFGAICPCPDGRRPHVEVVVVAQEPGGVGGD